MTKATRERIVIIGVSVIAMFAAINKGIDESRKEELSDEFNELRFRLNSVIFIEREYAKTIHDQELSEEKINNEIDYSEDLVSSDLSKAEECIKNIKEIIGIKEHKRLDDLNTPNN